eukprot:TRINITY_DN559_c1_g1_i1.p1 TRINITY_DN559_c1_g1~~TRINITY_DN559_c1_g1_i1.p1  ORF type:complete len:263 (+),score=27.08 TRINITY_DN559_c1_g1_i1:64-852(+)
MRTDRLLLIPPAVLLVSAMFDYLYPYTVFREVDHKLRSQVITSSEGWENEGYLIPHEPIRRDIELLREFDSLLTSVDRSPSPSTKQKLVSWYLLFSEQLGLHAKSEDDYFFRFFDSKRETVESERNLIEDHHQIEKFLAMDPEELFFTNEGNLKRLTDLLQVHFDEEEKRYRPMFGVQFTEDEWKAAVKDSHSAYTLQQTTRVLPHIMHALGGWASPERRDAFDAKLPWFIRQLLHRFWLPSYYEHYIDPVSEIREGLTSGQ